MTQEFLKTDITVPRLRWTRVKSVAAAASAAPPCPGVYILAEVEHQAGYLLRAIPRYVGKSQALGQRLGQHHPRFETHPELRKWLLERPEDVEVAFATLALADVDPLEQELIRRLQPKFNRIRYLGSRNGTKR
jgi:excinuclease UvrABC nuclease subunit